ncbi:MAG: hypothetical protein BWX52_01898 [Bacteroidetes bacterium ADurb.Bin013]|jgi:Tfp pilus assembly protein PilX|nr:MAG: hypothetical protein BWX52_01898 [Bacteroidetes bacterium ADurb.Bin013]HPN87659.1 PilX N-terminal domain-containing pilus assembly protein [Smithella sp.]
MRFPQLMKTARNEKGVVLVVAVMLLAVLVLVGFTAAIMTSTDSKISANYRRSNEAFFNADAGVETVLAYLRTNTVTYPTVDATPSIINGGTCPAGQCVQLSMTVPSGYAFSGTVNLYGYNVANRRFVFRMTGTGSNNATRTIETYIRKNTSVPENADGAVAMYGGGPQVAFKTGGGGGYAVDGHDYPVPANPNCNGSACSTSPTGLPAIPGLFTVMAPTTTGNVSAHLGGVPTQTMGISREAEYNAFAQMIIDSGGTGAPLYQTTLGTRANPAVTVIPNGSTLNGSGNGAGIIIVEDGGSLQINGNFEYEGLVILRGSGRVFGSGTGNIYGSLVTVSHLSKLIDLTGSINLFYSSAALANLSNIGALNSVQRVAWRDVQ